MGFQNARQVSLHWADLPGNAFKVFNMMAWISLDARPEWWGTPERLVLSLGRKDWPRDADHSRKAMLARARGYRAVQRALADLAEHGAITVEVEPRGTRKGFYVLNLEPTFGADKHLTTPVDNPLGTAVDSAHEDQ